MSCATQRLLWKENSTMLRPIAERTAHDLVTFAVWLEYARTP